MSPSTKTIFVPEWLIYWIRNTLLPALGLQPLQMVFSLLKGIFDTLLLVLLGFGFITGGNLYMESQYDLPRSIQVTALKWAPYADYIARQTDIPREVPLVIWFKENSMKAVNPDLCTGIMGAYDLVRSGQYPCFTPGPISDLEVSRQLAIGAVEFKKRCPDVTYWTQDPDLIKRCYFAYNAGVGAASRLDPNQSAYVMNNYSEAYQNMTYSDVELGTVQVTALGAWPAHLAIQSLVISSWDEEGAPVQLSLSTISARVYDSVSSGVLDWRQIMPSGAVDMTFPEERPLAEADCFGKTTSNWTAVVTPNL